jgi:DNA-binding NarL/FixJ family response regulator
MDGVQAIRMIKEQWPSINVIVLTMFATERASATAAGADAFFIKGASIERLLAAIARRAAPSKT